MLLYVHWHYNTRQAAHQRIPLLFCMKVHIVSLWQVIYCTILIYRSMVLVIFVIHRIYMSVEMKSIFLGFIFYFWWHLVLIWQAPIFYHKPLLPTRVTNNWHWLSYITRWLVNYCLSYNVSVTNLPGQPCPSTILNITMWDIFTIPSIK